MFPLSSSTFFEVSIIDILLPNLSDLVLMIEFFIFFFILVCNYFSRQIICFPIFSLLSFKIKFSLFLQNRCFVDFSISISCSLVTYDNYSGDNLETTLGKWSFSVETWIDSNPIEERDEVFSFDYNYGKELNFSSCWFLPLRMLKMNMLDLFL